MAAITDEFNDAVAAAADIALFFVGVPENEMLVSLQGLRSRVGGAARVLN